MSQLVQANNIAVPMLEKQELQRFNYVMAGASAPCHTLPVSTRQSTPKRYQHSNKENIQKEFVP